MEHNQTPYRSRDFSRAQVTRENGQELVYEVPLKKSASRRFPAEKFVAFMTVDRAGQQLIDLDLCKVFQRDDANPTLQAGDVLVIGYRSDTLKLDWVRDQVRAYSSPPVNSGAQQASAAAARP